MPTPDLPAISREQALRDLQDGRMRISGLLADACHRMRIGYSATEAHKRAQEAMTELEWITDRLAIAETGPLGRVPRTGAADTSA